MSDNMFLEDVLALLGRAGTVTLRKGTNDTSGTPGYVADTEGWTCEITLRGYLRPWGHGGFGGSILRLTGEAEGEASRPRNLTALQAARRTLDELERFLNGDAGRRCRACYEKDAEFYGRPIAPEIKLDTLV